MPKNIIVKSFSGINTSLLISSTGHTNASAMASIEPALVNAAQYAVDIIMAKSNMLLTSTDISSNINNIIHNSDSYKYLTTIGINMNIFNNSITGLSITDPVVQKLIINYSTNYIIDDNDLTILFNEFVKPFLNEGPLFMSSVGGMSILYGNLTILKNNTNNPVNKTIIEILQDVLTILSDSRSIYFENIQLEKSLCILRKKYIISENKILELTNELDKLMGEKNYALSFTGSLGMRIKQPKNLIYAQAILNVNLAWYYYLHNKRKIELELYNATVQYVKSIGTREEAYDKLIVLLDEEFKDINDLLIPKV